LRGEGKENLIVCVLDAEGGFNRIKKHTSVELIKRSLICEG